MCYLTILVKTGKFVKIIMTLSVLYIGMNREIHNYIVKDLLASNAFYWTTGCPQKREQRIREYAWYLLTNMSDERYNHYERLVDGDKRRK